MQPEGIVSTPAGFLAALESGRFPADSPIFPKAVLMVEPANFQVADESLVDNRYLYLDRADDPERALAQSRALAATVRACGGEVVCFLFTSSASFPASDSGFGGVPLVT